MDIQQMMTSKQASDYLGISNDYFRLLVRGKKIKAAVTGHGHGRRLYFKREWLDAWRNGRVRIIEANEAQ
jgi:excisionase family DNA binding protein